MLSKPKGRKFWPLVIRVLVAVALFAWLGTHLDWKSIGNTLAAIDPKWAALALLVLWTGLGIAVVRWHVLLKALGSDFHWGETVRVFGGGLFLSLFLPTSIGGDVYRLARVGRSGFGAGRAGVSLLVERGIGLLALLLLVAPVVAENKSTQDLVPLALGLGLSAVSILFLFGLWGRPVTTFLARRVPLLEPVLGHGTWEAIVSTAPTVFFLSLLNHLATIGSNYLLARALHVSLGFWDAMALIPLVILAGQLPIAPGGLGVREAAFVYFLGRAGIGHEQALAVGLAWLASLYLTGGVGALLFLSDRRREPRQAPLDLETVPLAPSGVDSPANPP
ncbi:MAG TPA: lysylphosphatidylglycerol synthase transmembrane domain-containing protein [Candidatus Eisenbacteria bacterium]|nr:lysylphosphatidylglycerol synthase transmembrane domain-containing protein [Candidatus Eisenbacteria bacterium]